MVWLSKFFLQRFPGKAEDRLRAANLNNTKNKKNEKSKTQEETFTAGPEIQ